MGPEISRLAAVLLLIAGPAAAQDAAARMDEVVRQQVDKKQFMGAVLVARAGAPVFSRAYGFANLEWEVPNTTDAKFRIGSVSKQFTAAAILLLEQSGKLRVEDLVKKHLPDAPPAWDKITIHHVLTHTSGIPSFTGFADYAVTKKLPATLENLYQSFRNRPLDFEPGQKWTYSNSGYVLLALLVEKVSGMKYDDYLREKIFGPLGMKDTMAEQNGAVVKHRAYGYTPALTSVFRAADYIDMTVPTGAGALLSTTGDLMLWNEALYGGKLLSAESLRKMTTPFKNNYAYGLAVRTVDGRQVIGHGGGIEGFNCFLAYYPGERITVAVLANQNSRATEQMATRLGGIAHGDK